MNGGLLPSTTKKQMPTANATALKKYSVVWYVSCQLPARMEVEAPEGLTEEELIQFIDENCSADFEIDTDELDYSDGFCEIRNCFDFDYVED